MLFFFCLRPCRSCAQFYPALPPVPASQLHQLLQQVRAASNATQRIPALTALGNLYLNLPLKKTADLATAQRYAQQALDESIQANNQAGKADALLLLGQLYFVKKTPGAIEQLLAQAGDTTKAKLLLQLSLYYWNRDADDKTKDYVTSIAYAKQAAVLSEKLGIKELSLMCRRNIAINDAMLRKPGAEANLLNIVNEYQQAGYKKLQYIYLPVTYYFHMISRADKAYYYSQAAVNAVNETKDTLAAGDVYMIKGILDYHRENYSDAVASGKQALQFYSRQSGLYAVSSPLVHGIISAAYDKMGEKTTAINYIKSVLQQYPPNEVEDSIQLLTRIGHAYRELKRFPEAENYFLQVYALSRRSHFGEQNANVNLGQLYLDARQYEKARPYLYKALAMQQPDERESSQRVLHYMLFLVDSATHHYLSALGHQSFLNDQAAVQARLERDKEVKRMEVAYKALEKEQELKLKNQHILFLQQQAGAQQEKLQQSQKIGLLIAGGLALSLVILALLFFLYRQKQRSSRKMLHKNQLLQKLVSEKERLLKEVHHRVKNNLHTIFCLLESQARTATPEARTALEKSQHRIYAMSLFHQKIYQSDDIEKVDFGNYIRDFLVFLEDGYDLEARNIRVAHELAPVSLQPRLAMPLALIANEALTNAAKYAFEGRTSGVIRLSLIQQDEACRMTICDNGIGMPNPGSSVNRSLGMELMYGLCAEIGAEINFEVNNGTRICITFNAA